MSNKMVFENLKEFILHRKTAKELIEVIEIAQNEGYGHSEGIEQLLDGLKIFAGE